MAAKSNLTSNSGQQTPAWYKESRKKDASSTGSIVFTILRLAEIPWQYYFLSSGLGHSLLVRLGASTELLPPSTSLSALRLGLHPYHAIILTLAAGTTASQIFWAWSIRENYFPPSGATAVALYNTLLNTINSVLALWAVTSQAPSQDSRGKLWWSEVVARKNFKARPENQGKPFSGGFFGIVRNANYTGYTLMRIGYALVCGGWTWGAVIGGIVFSDFAFRAVPWLDGYCAERYGQQWQEVKKKVPSRLLPGIF